MPKFAIEVTPAGDPTRIWEFQGGAARSVVPDTSTVVSGAIANASDLAAAAVTQSAAPTENSFRDLPWTARGQYYSRIYRPVFQAPYDFVIPESPGERAARISTGTQIESLVANLRAVFRTIEPTPENFDAFGHDVRNLIILASTEVESQWRGILKANNVRPDRGTDGYVGAQYGTISAALRLREYELQFTVVPLVTPLRPFDNWIDGNPTNSLSWYKAYHSVKHGRESSFAEAKLIYAMRAVAASVIVHVAAYMRWPGTGLGEYFNITKQPSWGAVDHVIMPEQLTQFCAVPFPDLA